jgi:hypothetical protein
MADKKFSAFTEDTNPSLTDVLVGLTGGDNKKMQIQNITKKIQLAIAGGYPHAEGQISYDAVSKFVQADTGISGVRITVGQDALVPVYNDTGGPIAKGIPIAGSGLYVGGLPSVVIADADNILHILGFLGIASATIADGEIGLATILGAVKDVDTSLLSVAPIFLASGGGLTQTAPVYPTNRFLIGGATVSDAVNGILGVSPVRIPRQSASKSYSYQSVGVTSPVDWKGGFYDWSTVDANLTQASTSVTYGTTGQVFAAHVGVVPSGAGTVDAGQVGLRVTGTLDSETGVQVAAQTKIITDDITSLSANVMAETLEKFSGEVLIELYVVSGSPTTYSLDFNYGFSKYEDFQNRDVTITAFEAVWIGGAADAGFDISLMHHKPAGWTYAATGFLPGNGDIIRRSVDQAIDGNVANGIQGSWKRIDINRFIDSNALEGVIIEITTNSPNTIQTMDMHLVAVSEELN